jgi:hypothetical protein
MTTPSRPWLLGAAVALALATAAPDVRADRADELFAAGEKAFESKDLQGARARFLEAYAIRPSFDVLANLGLVESRLGLLRDAAEHLAAALATFPPSGDPAVKRAMESDLAGLAKKLGRVVVEAGAGAQLRVDDTDRGLVPARGSVELWLDPGEHRLEATDPERGDARANVRITPGSEQTLVLRFTTSASQSSDTVDPSRDEPGDAWPLWPGFVVGGVGVAGLGVGAIFAVLASSASDDAASLTAGLEEPRACLRATPAPACTEIQASLEDRDTLSNVSLGAFVGAGVLTAAGATLLVLHTLDTPTPDTTSSIGIAPWMGPGQVGGTLTGRF